MSEKRRSEWINGIVSELGLSLLIRSLPGLRRMLSLRPIALVGTVLLGAGLLLADLVSLGVLVPMVTLVSPSLAEDKVLAGVPLLSTVESLLQRFEPSERLLTIAALVAAVGIVRSGLLFSRNYLYFWTLYRVMLDIEALCYRQFARVPLARVLAGDAGKFMNLLIHLPRDVAAAVLALSSLSVGVIQFAGYLTVVLALSWTMGVAALGVLGFALLMVGALLMSRIQAAGRELNDRSAEFHQWVMETIRGRSVIDGLGLTEFSQRRFRDRGEAYFTAIAVRERLRAMTEPSLLTVAFLVIAAVLLITALTPGDLAVKVPRTALFVICLSRLITPLSSINASLTDIRASANSIARVSSFLVEERRTPQLGAPFHGLIKAVTLHDVGLIYTGAQRPALLGINLTVRRGAMVALVGPSGAGKSSIVSLLLRFYDPTSGTVEADGVDVRHYSEESWLRRVAYVPQDAHLFNDSIEANIRIGLEGLDRESVVTAARLAHAHDFILAQPEGYATRVGEGGARLSGGQKQRIAIARAVLRDPDLIILDEATSQLDSESERAIHATLSDLRNRCAVLVVAHRLSTVAEADEIVVMRDGGILERGAHSELLAKGGLYARLWQLQAAGVVDGIAADRTAVAGDNARLPAA